MLAELVGTLSVFVNFERFPSARRRGLNKAFQPRAATRSRFDSDRADVDRCEPGRQLGGALPWSNARALSVDSPACAVWTAPSPNLMRVGVCASLPSSHVTSQSADAASVADSTVETSGGAGANIVRMRGWRATLTYPTRTAL